MTTREYQFCETKRKRITFLNPIGILQTLISKPKLTLQNIVNGLTVVKECIVGRSDSWLVHAEFYENPIAKTVPLTKRKPSKDMLRLMVEGYQDSANDDLALAKEFEGLEPEIDDNCDQ